MSGTNGFAGAVDTPAILMRPDRSEKSATLFVMGRDMDGDTEFQVELSGRARWELVGGSPAAAARSAAEASTRARVAKLGEDKQEILAIVESFSPREVTVAEVEAAYTGAHRARVAVNLSELAKSGLIVRAERGVYRAKIAPVELTADSHPF